MLRTLKRFGLPVIFGAALALLTPTVSFARDHDREWREHERHEWREHHHRFRGYVYFGPSYSHGYYDQWGHWRPYGRGYYDRWGYWHPYGY